jgi:hypothetical protein
MAEYLRIRQELDDKSKDLLQKRNVLNPYDLGNLIDENARALGEIRSKIEVGASSTIYTPRIGGTGMETHYDTVLPKAANKIGKKFGTVVQKTNLNDGSPAQTGNYKFPEGVHFLPFTPSLKESVKKTSFPLWQIGAGAVGLESIYEQTNPNANSIK